MTTFWRHFDDVRDGIADWRHWRHLTTFDDILTTFWRRSGRHCGLTTLTTFNNIWRHFDDILTTFGCRAHRRLHVLMSYDIVNDIADWRHWRHLTTFDNILTTFWRLSVAEHIVDYTFSCRTTSSTTLRIDDIDDIWRHLTTFWRHFDDFQLQSTSSTTRSHVVRHR